jgi:hypothetical protein
MDLNRLGVERARRRDWIIAGLMIVVFALAAGALINSIDASEPTVFRASTDQITAINHSAVKVSYTVENVSPTAAIPACVVNVDGPTGNYSENTLGTTALGAGRSIRSSVTIIIINGGATRITLSATAIHCNTATQ